MITKTCVEMMTPFIIPHSSVFWTVYVPPNFLSRRLDKHDITAVWSDGLFVETISGNLQIDEVKAIVDSIGG